jgi:hypothetical protein
MTVCVAVDGEGLVVKTCRSRADGCLKFYVALFATHRFGRIFVPAVAAGEALLRSLMGGRQSLRQLEVAPVAPGDAAGILVTAIWTMHDQDLRIA